MWCVLGRALCVVCGSLAYLLQLEGGGGGGTFKRIRAAADDVFAESPKAPKQHSKASSAVFGLEDLAVRLRGLRDRGLVSSTLGCGPPPASPLTFQNDPVRAVFMTRLAALASFVQHLTRVHVDDAILCPVERLLHSLQASDVSQLVVESVLRAMDINVR